MVVMLLECIVWVIDKGSLVCGGNVIGVYYGLDKGGNVIVSGIGVYSVGNR